MAWLLLHEIPLLELLYLPENLRNKTLSTFGFYVLEGQLLIVYFIIFYLLW